MNKLITSTAVPTRELKLEAIANISASFELLCLASGMEALGEMKDRLPRRQYRDRATKASQL
jgi:hypothetical protein